jgi:very-short-patch-repair endonuclease
MRSEGACKSKIQYEAGQLLKEEFPKDIILEEVYLPDGFYLDFFIPSRKIAVEVQGRQHTEFVPFFHGSRGSYLKSVARDQRKAQWCLMNEIELRLL